MRAAVVSKQLNRRIMTVSTKIQIKKIIGRPFIILERKAPRKCRRLRKCNYGGNLSTSYVNSLILSMER